MLEGVSWQMSTEPAGGGRPWRRERSDRSQGLPPPRSKGLPRNAVDLALGVHAHQRRQLLSQVRFDVADPQYAQKHVPARALFRVAEHRPLMQLGRLSPAPASVATVDRGPSR